MRIFSVLYRLQSNLIVKFKYYTAFLFFFKHNFWDFFKVELQTANIPALMNYPITFSIKMSVDDIQ